MSGHSTTWSTSPYNHGRGLVLIMGVWLTAVDSFLLSPPCFVWKNNLTHKVCLQIAADTSATSDFVQDGNREKVNLVGDIITGDIMTGATNNNNSNNSNNSNRSMKIVKNRFLTKRHNMSKREMADTDVSFLLKKTELLLKLTASDYRMEEEVGNVNRNNLKINKSTFSWLIEAWRIHEGGAVHAEALVRRMQEMSAAVNDNNNNNNNNNNSESSFTPDVKLFTKVIHMLSRSKLRDAGTKAEQILDWMEELSQSGQNAAARPNALTYTAVIESYANKYTQSNSNEHEHSFYFAHRADAIFHRLEDRYRRSNNNPNLRPTARTFHALILAWSRSGEVGAADKAHDILQQHIQYLEEETDTNNQIAAPKASTFNAVIDAYAKSGEKTSVSKAEQLFANMNQLYQTTNNSHVKPNTKTYNSLLNAYAKSGQPDAAYRAEQTLDKMIELANDNAAKTTDPVKPDATSFATVIHAWARSHNFGKAEHALKLLKQMDTLYTTGTNLNVKPNVIVFNSVMNACAFTIGNELEQVRALNIAHTMFKELESRPTYGKPDSITYGTYLKVCANQMNDGELRKTLVTAVFKKCVKEGQVGELVLQQLQLVADDTLFKELTHKDKTRSPMLDVPKEWNRNVNERKKGIRNRRPVRRQY